MGCHIYIHKLEDHSEVQLPYFISCRSLEFYDIKTKKEFEAFLIFHKLVSEDYINSQIHLLESLNTEINGEPIKGVPEEYQYHYDAKDRLLKEYQRNSGFLQHKEKHGENAALIYIQTWEIERAKSCAVTQEMIDKLLSIFVEGEHYICTA